MNRHAYDLYSDAEWEAVQARSVPFTTQMKTVLKEDPGIPVFCALTVFALFAGMRQSFIVRDPSKANFYMFLRIGGQAGAAGAMGYSLFRVQNRDKKIEKEIETKIAQKLQNENKEAV